MPVLGIVASQISGHLFAPSGAYDSIATTTVSTAVSSITFSSIPSTYTHLQLRATLRTSDSGSYAGDIVIQFNSDTGTNYSNHILYGNGSSAGAAGASSQSKNYTIFTSTAIAGASYFGAAIVDVLDYANTNKYKTIRSLSGADYNNTNGQVRFGSSVWLNTNAVSTITLTDYVGTNFAQYSSFALYGIKGA
jgi:hypothetical protein